MGTNVSTFNYQLGERSLGNNSHSEFGGEVTITPGLDAGIGVPGFAGADIEVNANPELSGVNAEFSGSIGPYSGSIGVSIGLEGVGVNYQLGIGYIGGLGANTELFFGPSTSVIVTRDGVKVERELVAEASQGLIVGSIDASAAASAEATHRDLLSFGSGTNPPRNTLTDFAANEAGIATRETFHERYSISQPYDLTGAVAHDEFGLYIDVGPHGPTGDIWYDTPVDISYEQHGYSTVNKHSDGSTVTSTVFSTSGDNGSHPGPGQLGNERTTQTHTEYANGSSSTTTNYSNGSKSQTSVDKDGNGTHTATTSSGYSVTYTQSNHGAEIPILLDLSGAGIEITELSQSTVFMDATGDGLLNRTAWAAEGNGVLFYDPDNTGEISEKRQYVFTEWDPTATSDIKALHAKRPTR